MKLKKQLTLTMTKEENSILNQAVDILTDIEMNFDTDYIKQIQDRYEEEVDFVPHTTPLPTAIDYIGTLLGMAVIVEDMGEDNDEN